MPRKPLGEGAMTPAERQRRRRANMYRLNPRPWDGTQPENCHEAETISHLTSWLMFGDEYSVTKWLAENLAARRDWLSTLNILRTEIEELHEQNKILAAAPKEPDQRPLRAHRPARAAAGLGDRDDNLSTVRRDVTDKLSAALEIPHVRPELPGGPAANGR
jgi:hypothetical protein